MDVRLYFPSLYLGAPDLHGKDVTLTIVRVVVEELKTDRGSERKPCVFFVETKTAAAKAGTPDKEKRLVLNKTNGLAIAALYGHEVNGWPGKRITLFPTTCQSFGKTVDCIRIRPVAPSPATVTETAAQDPA